MEIKKITVGMFETNCYILYQNDGCLVIDPGDDYQEILKQTKGYNLEGILVTHYHFDHVGALNDLLKNDCSEVFNYRTLGKQETKNFKFEVVLNKGHKEDCVSFVFDDVMFVGDFIFRDGLGRTDLPGGSMAEMEKSLENLKEYYKDYTIYPGHGPKTTLKYELKNNPYLNNTL